MGSAVILIMANDVIEDIMVSCLNLPVCGFATPKTRLGTNPICTSCNHLRLNVAHLLLLLCGNEWQLLRLRASAGQCACEPALLQAENRTCC